MAASSLNGGNVVRVRLYFDFPPPYNSSCRMCWFLIDLNNCRVVADLVSDIRERFGYSRKTSLDLFIEDCFLPFSESIYIVRDNDSIRVKADSLSPPNGAEADTPESKSNKRTRKHKEQEVEEEHTSKRRKIEQGQCTQVDETENGKTRKKKKKKKKKKNKKRNQEQANEQPPGPVSKPGFEAKHKDSSSSTDSDSGSVQQTPKKAAPARPLPAKPNHKPNAAVNTKTKSPPRKTVESSSSDSDSSTSAERCPLPVRVHPPASSSNSKALASAGDSKEPPAKPAETSSDSDSIPGAATREPEPEPKPAAVTLSEQVCEKYGLVIRKANLKDMGMTVAEPVTNGPPAGAGTNREDVRNQEKCAPLYGRVPKRFRGTGRRWFDRPYSKGFGGASSDEDQTKASPVSNLQQSSEPVPPRDYSVFPLLAAPPPIGQKIAFKRLELTEDYCPAVSDYKEGKVTGFSMTRDYIELELLSRPKVPAQPGKFDLVYESQDGSEVVEYAVNQGTLIMERWDALLEPRLIVDD